MHELLLPSEVEFTQGESAVAAELVISPCFFGYGTTLGNALRRVLLSSLPGAAVEAFKIKGTSHEFSSVEGVKEDVVDIILNLKQVAVKVFTDEPVILKINKKGKGKVTAGDIEPNANAEIINKDLLIATLTTDKEFEMTIIAGRGRGYKPAEEKDKADYDLGTIVIDSLYNPVKDVGYSVEYTRVGDVTNYEKLNLKIETNGVLSPREAVYQSTKIITDHFNIISNTLGEMTDSASDESEQSNYAKITEEEQTEEIKPEVDEDKKKANKTAKENKKKPTAKKVKTKK
ncbi:MAG: DNA-directed RNA polymerase subunit alpha [Candidatus Magasanikbacteria bacterium CG10_big_fil_rev_8_21_14_0_10_40_10]|uniref:DNA-directed RNA polymerase subunit alpha n=1 Tax=Candidatus Magasanikbacteria bacterium CG10_big_fil_rev_8_21_14_0_10_40_10 TaxID=1974648 RepID=A0A2M6W4V0_9BACT|nr:MAG: DNA-directed RNA polymerase subunit alpha [Candidatus Magasanikbacteria bacterium CG10_big_fil_rev_8_21_14_0_10_40_10]